MRRTLQLTMSLQLHHYSGRPVFTRGSIALSGYWWQLEHHCFYRQPSRLHFPRKIRLLKILNKTPRMKYYTNSSLSCLYVISSDLFFWGGFDAKISSSAADCCIQLQPKKIKRLRWKFNLFNLIWFPQINWDWDFLDQRSCSGKSRL